MAPQAVELQIPARWDRSSATPSETCRYEGNVSKLVINLLRCLVRVFAAQHIVDSGVAIGSRDHPVRRDGLPAHQLHSYCSVVLYQNMFDFGSQTQPPAKAAEPMYDALDDRLRAANRIGRIAPAHPCQRKEESESGQVPHIASPQRNPVSVDP